MPLKYVKKLVVSGKICELYEYSDFRFLHFATQKKGRCAFRHEAFRTQQVNFRAKQTIRNLVNSNPELCRFLTLTYSKNEQNLTRSNLQFKNFIKKIRYKFESLKYVCIVEFQKRGAIHYHLVWNHSYIRKKCIESLWKNGFVSISYVKNIKNVGAYFSKHGTKDNYQFECKKLAGRKKFFCSRGLNRPIEMYNEKSILEFLKQKKDLLFQNVYGDKWQGDLVFYKQFKLC